MGDTRRNQYFIPGDGIAREVITADICKYLDNDALVRPGNYQGIEGYYIFAYRNLTREMIEDLKADSSRWDNEKRNRHRPNHRGGPSDYVNSRTHANRAGMDSSYSDEPYVNGAMGNAMPAPPRGGAGGMSGASRTNASPYSNDVGGFGSSSYGSAAQPRSAGLPATSAYPSSGHMSTSSGAAGYGAVSSAGPPSSFGVSSAGSNYGAPTTQSYAPPPSTAPIHGSRHPPSSRSTRTDARSGGYDYGDSRVDSRPYTDQSRSAYGGDSGRRRY